MSKVVCKFGGTSMATSRTMEQVKNIVLQNRDRHYVVVSAPGKAHKTDTKITDLLYRCADEASKTGQCPSFAAVRERFHGIVSELNLDLDIGAVLNEIETQILATKSADYAASRGEYLSAYVTAKYLGFEFVDAAELIVFNEKGEFLSNETNENVARILEGKQYVVIPGFYGRMPNGAIKTFSRGGSDITGAIIARGVLADIYENWTDVDGFLVTDPRIVEDPEQIYCLSYKELRELSYMGASVLHAESIFPVSVSAIPIHIKNTFHQDNPGTMIVPSISGVPDDGRPITGIAGKKGFTEIKIEKDLMNEEVAFIRKVLSVMERHHLSVEHTPTGIDTLTVIVDAKHVTHLEMQEIVRELEADVNPDLVEIVSNISLIATVGRNVVNNRDTASRLFGALSRNRIEVRMIDQGSSGLNIIIGVDDNDFDRAIKAIYQEFYQ